MLRKLQHLIAGLYLWIRMGIPLREAMDAAKQAEEITRDL